MDKPPPLNPAQQIAKPPSTPSLHSEKSKDRTAAQRQKKYRDKKKLIGRELAPTANSNLAGLEGEDRERATALLMERGAKSYLKQFLYYATVFLNVGITGTASLDNFISFPEIWDAFLRFVEAWPGIEGVSGIINYKNEFLWLLVGFVSPKIGYRITDVHPSDSQQQDTVSDRWSLGVAKLPSPFLHNSSDEEILRRNLAWEQFKTEILESAKKAPIREPPPQKPEWVKIELKNVLPPDPSDTATYNDDLEELRRLAMAKQPLPLKKKFHPEIERILAENGSKITLNSEQKEQLNKTTKETKGVRPEWIFLGIMLNKKAIENKIKQVTGAGTDRFRSTLTIS